MDLNRAKLNDQERRKILRDAQKIACELTEKRDFAFVTKVDLALIARNLVIDFHRKQDEITAVRESLSMANSRIKHLEKFGNGDI